MISVAVDTAKMRKLQEKFAKYPPYAIKRGLEAANNYLNDPAFKDSMYPGSVFYPFQWQSERQRRAYFATDGFGHGIPYSRTGNLARSGKFTVNERSFWIEYSNSEPSWIFVIHPQYQQRGHKATGWPKINAFTVKASGKIVPLFRKGALAAWNELESFMYSGGAGL